jgi:hypothetical protein
VCYMLISIFSSSSLSLWVWPCLVCSVLLKSMLIPPS